MISQCKIIRAGIFLFIVFLNIHTSISAADNIITIYCEKEIGIISEKIFGNNLTGYDPVTFEKRTSEYNGHSDYGSGIWNPKWNKAVAEVINLAKDAGLSVLRFPGGCGTHQYSWKDAIGKNRKRFKYGIDEFLKTCEGIGAEPIITLSYFTGNDQDDADLVEYLNSYNNGYNPNGGVDWAKERTINGREQPYNVKYFEIGNEVYHGGYHKNRNFSNMMPEVYAQRYLNYYRALKGVDTSIKIGVVLCDHLPSWDRKIIEIIGENVDFGIVHTYPSPVKMEKLETWNTKDVFRTSFALPILKDEIYLQETLKSFKEKSGKDVPLAITEYNGGFIQERPVPYRHCLGNALLNAELLRIFMKPEHKILMANYWQFCNDYFGMIKAEDDYTRHDYRKPISYVKRPNYYVYELYHKHFGNKLLDVSINCSTYSVECFKEYFKNAYNRILKNSFVKENLLLDQSWEIRYLDGVYVSDLSGIVEIDFKVPKQLSYYHVAKRVTVEPTTFYKVSGYIKADSLRDDTCVCLEVQDGRGWKITRSAISTEKIKGTLGWCYVEAIYETLPDAKDVLVTIRRISETGPLYGKVFVKDVKLCKIIPDKDSFQIPYLSVNASKSSDDSKVYLMVINKNLDESITANINLVDFTPARKGDAWVLNGPSVDATNENNPNNVKVKHVEFQINNNNVVFTFEPHSLTAVELERN